jgi:TIR domain
MADIFISHSMRDRDATRTLATILERQGWSVCWDKSVLNDQDVQNARMAELCNAQLVIVIWSKSSASDPFILQEALAARDASKLLHVTNSDAQPKQIPVRRRNEPMLDAIDLMQISMAVASFMRQRGRRPISTRIDA